jgi:hypothetical protein
MATSEELIRLATERQEQKEKARTLPQAPQRRNGHAVPTPARQPEPGTDSGFLTLSEAFDWPGRGTTGVTLVYVHPSSLEDTWWAGEQAALAVNAHAEARKEKLTGPQFEYRMAHFTRPYVVIAVCRTGPDPDSPQAFAAADAEDFRTNPAYRRPIGQVLAISERLGGEDFLRSGFDALFFGIEERLLILSSSSSMDSPETICANLAALAGFVSLLRQRQTLSAEGFPDVIEAPEPDEEEVPLPELVEA